MIQIYSKALSYKRPHCPEVELRPLYFKLMLQIILIINLKFASHWTTWLAKVILSESVVLKVWSWGQHISVTLNFQKHTFLGPMAAPNQNPGHSRAVCVLTSPVLKQAQGDSDAGKVCKPLAKDIFKYLVVSCSVMSYSLHPKDWSLPGSSIHGLTPGQNSGVCSHSLPQGVFPTQGSNPGLLHCRQILYYWDTREIS